MFNTDGDGSHGFVKSGLGDFWKEIHYQNNANNSFLNKAKNPKREFAWCIPTFIYAQLYFIYLFVRLKNSILPKAANNTTCIFAVIIIIMTDDELIKPRILFSIMQRRRVFREATFNEKCVTNLTDW